MVARVLILQAQHPRAARAPPPPIPTSPAPTRQGKYVAHRRGGGCGGDGWGRLRRPRPLDRPTLLMLQQIHIRPVAKVQAGIVQANTVQPGGEDSGHRLVIDGQPAHIGNG